MTSNDGVELKCTIDADMPWKMVAKGSRSSTRRTKKSVAASDVEGEDKISSGTLAGESEPEKLGVSVPGQHFAERVEHIPIKKRRFMVPSPSNKSSEQLEGSEDTTQINNALPVSRLNPNLIDGRTANVLNENHDFSGIEILANVACSTDMNNAISPAVESLLVEESVVQQQDASTLSTHVEGNDSSAGTADISQKYYSVDSSDQGGQGKSEIIAPQKSPIKTLCSELSDEQSVEYCRLTCGGMTAAKKPSIALSDESSTERPKTDMGASESKNLAPDSGAVTVSGKSSADELTEKNNEGLKDDRFHWDLNVPMDAWDQHCDVKDEACGRDVEGEITESNVSKESEPVDDGRKDRMVEEVIASDGHGNFSSPSGPKFEAATGDGKECQSGYDSQFEDGELREPYPWEENEGETGEIEQVDYGSEPEDERFYSMVESNDNKMEDSEKGILAEAKLGSVKCDSGDAPKTIREANAGSDIDKHIVVCMNDSHFKKRSSSPSRSFVSKPYKELPSHDAIHRRRYDNYEDLSTGPDKFVGRNERSGMRMRNRSPGRGYFSGWDSKRRFSPPNYKGGSYGFGRPQPKSMVADRGMMSGFDQSGSGPGPGPDGHVRRQFSNGGYRGRFRRFPDGGDRDFRGRHSDTNQFPGRMHDRMSGNRRERGNSPVSRRLNYPQSESRSRSRSPVTWNGQNRSSPPPGGFRTDERMMERVRLPFHKRFPGEQEMGYMSPPRNRMSSPRFFEERNNDNGESFRESKFRRGQRFDTGYSMRRPNSDNNNHFRPFIRHRRFDGAEENTGGGGNRYEMAQQQRTPRRSETLEDGGDGIRRFKFNREEQAAVVANNNNKESC